MGAHTCAMEKKGTAHVSSTHTQTIQRTQHTHTLIVLSEEPLTMQPSQNATARTQLECLSVAIQSPVSTRHTCEVEKGEERGERREVSERTTHTHTHTQITCSAYFDCLVITSTRHNATTTRTERPDRIGVSFECVNATAVRPIPYLQSA